MNFDSNNIFTQNTRFNLVFVFVFVLNRDPCISNSCGRQTDNYGPVQMVNIEAPLTMVFSQQQAEASGLSLVVQD